MRSFKTIRGVKSILLLLAWPIGAGLAACSSDQLSGYTQNPNEPAYYANQPGSSCEDDTQSYSGNDWLNHKSNSAYWQQRAGAC